MSDIDLPGSGLCRLTIFDNRTDEHVVGRILTRALLPGPADVRVGGRLLHIPLGGDYFVGPLESGEYELTT